MSVKRDFFSALVGAKYALRAQQLAVMDVRDLQKVTALGTSPAEWEQFAAFLTHWENFLNTELERFAPGASR